MTNADKIRQMTDEQIADAMMRTNADENIPYCQSRKECFDAIEKGSVDNLPCKACLLEWLGKECE